LATSDVKVIVRHSKPPTKFSDMRDGERLPNRSQATNANPKIPAIDAVISAVTATCLDISRSIPWASQAATIVVRIVVPALVMAHAIVFSIELLCVTKKAETQRAMASGRSAPHQSHIELCLTRTTVALN
jgi:hypothetical protein